MKDISKSNCEKNLSAFRETYCESRSKMSRGEKDAVVDLTKYLDQKVRVRLQGGREVEGILHGFDKLDNLVLDETIEYLRGMFVLRRLILI